MQKENLQGFSNKENNQTHQHLQAEQTSPAPLNLTELKLRSFAFTDEGRARSGNYIRNLVR